MTEFQKRTISGLVYMSVLIVGILSSSHIITFIISIFSGLALREFQRLIKFKSFFPLIVLILLMSYSVLGYISESFEQILLYVVLLLDIILLGFVFTKKKINYTIPVQIILSVCYLVGSSFFIIRSAFNNTEYNPWLIGVLFLAIWTNNIFAYLFGRKFGKHQLMPHISPKKSWEGFFGGMLFTILLTYYIESQIQIFGGLLWFLFAIMIIILATLGDLVQSYFKRVAKVKDSGNLIPGHGGFYDRMDSIIFVAPFYFLFLKLI